MDFEKIDTKLADDFSRQRFIAIAGERIKFVGNYRITPDQWHAIPDNPLQRDTVQRAIKAVHLHTLHPVHQKVVAARLPDGRLIKVEGHTRDYIWSGGLVDRGIVVPPSGHLEMALYDCADIEAVKEMYDVHDSTLAVDTPADKMFGTERELRKEGRLGEYRSPLFRSGRYIEAVKLLFDRFYGYQDRKAPDLLRRCVREFAPELMLLDGVMPPRDYFPTPIVMAALLSLRLNGRNALDFWDRYSSDAGIKLDGEMDGVEALRRAVDSARKEKKLRREHFDDMIGRAMNTFEQQSGRSYTYSTGVRKKKPEQLHELYQAAAKKKAPK